MKVYNLSFFSCPVDGKQKRSFHPAGAAKTEYILRCVEDADVEIVSPCWVASGEYEKGYTADIFPHVRLKLFTSIKAGNSLARALNRLLMRLRCFFYLLRRLNKDTVLLVYHSLFYCFPVRLLKKLTGCRLIMEIEEIYADVSEDERKRNKELRYFRRADSYLFPSVLLNRAVNLDQKEYAIVHGSYQYHASAQKKFDDGVVHCVYAGTLDPRKGGALNAVAAAQYLSEKYHIHILGFGNQSEIDGIREAIAQSASQTKCSVTYDGVLTGTDFENFLRACHIGLSTQNSKAKFNDTSFPSKVLMYLGNDLAVVSARLPVVTSSAVASLVTYYDSTPEEIANAIRSVDLNGISNAAVFARLDQNFRKELNGLIHVYG